MAVFSFIRGEKISNPISALVITGFEEDIDRQGEYLKKFESQSYADKIVSQMKKYLLLDLLM